MQNTDDEDIKEIHRKMDELAREYQRTRDPKIKAEIFALAARLQRLRTGELYLH